MLHHRVRRAVKAVMHFVPLPAQTNASCRISGHPGSGAVFRPSCETRRAHVYRQAHLLMKTVFPLHPQVGHHDIMIQMEKQNFPFFRWIGSFLLQSAARIPPARRVLMIFYLISADSIVFPFTRPVRVRRTVSTSGNSGTIITSFSLFILHRTKTY